jgi:hypothetical protein
VQAPHTKLLQVDLRKYAAAPISKAIDRLAEAAALAGAAAVDAPYLGPIVA